MFGEAMKKLCEHLKSQDVNMADMEALEFFAREGDWQTTAYANSVKSLEAWEIDDSFLPGLQKNLPGSIVRIVNSFEYGATTTDRFDFIVLDNPQGTYGPQEAYCEHFEALPIAIRLLKKSGIIIFNINYAPFNIDQKPNWMRRREQFYRVKDSSILSPTEFLLPYYSNYFISRRLKVMRSFIQPRNDEYLAYAVFHLEKQ